ncbi:DHH family phosphoesterase [Limnochorda pilosa]|uniref:Exopolyphosphatase n=1 Tax=Limnochorda pilosa TaxID=1555112 RepID=A0A0K2SK99_LIMPI|nr:bifunctional oligoribonuclease/PAP phosphatase NrnA [Limnochorda pilosa]BAS27541.1 exopolyphosphatase [Limnochorda pilosa]
MTVAEMARLLEQAGPTLVVAHEDPDPDSIGSILAARWVLRRVRPGLPVEAASPDPPPLSCRFLSGSGEVLGPDEALARGPWQTLWVVDCEPSRIGRLKPLVETAERLLNLDHHATNTTPSGHPAEARLIDPSAAATGLLIHRFIRHWGLRLDAEVATFLYAALMGDTGSFRYSNTSAEALAVAREALLAGARPDEVAHNLYERRTFDEMQLLGRALSVLARSDDGRIAWIALPHGWIAGDDPRARADATDGFVNYPRMVEGVEVALLFREVEPGAVRVSLRSQSSVDVSRIAAAFQGGGHPRAAGCTVRRPLGQAVDEVVRAVQAALGQGARVGG